MTTESKTAMISLRLPHALVARADFIARNTSGDIKSRSAALKAALEVWLPDQERKLQELGVIPKKAAR